MTEHSETKTRWWTGALERGPQEETYPRGAPWVSRLSPGSHGDRACRCLSSLLFCCFGWFVLWYTRGREEEKRTEARQEWGRLLRLMSQPQSWATLTKPNAFDSAIFTIYIILLFCLNDYKQQGLVTQINLIRQEQVTYLKGTVQHFGNLPVKWKWIMMLSLCACWGAVSSFLI